MEQAIETESDRDEHRKRRNSYRDTPTSYTVGIS